MWNGSDGIIIVKTIYFMLCAYLLIYDSMILRPLIPPTPPSSYYFSVHFFLFVHITFSLLVFEFCGAFVFTKTFSFQRLFMCSMRVLRNVSNVFTGTRKHTSNAFFLFHSFVCLSAADCQRNHKPRRIKCKMTKKKLNFFLR